MADKKDWEIVFTPLGPLQGVIYEQTGNRITRKGYLALVWAVPALLAGANGAPFGAAVFAIAAAWEAFGGAAKDADFDETDRLVEAAENRLALPPADPKDMYKDQGFLEYMLKKHGPDWTPPQLHSALLDASQTRPNEMGSFTRLLTQNQPVVDVPVAISQGWEGESGAGSLMTSEVATTGYDVSADIGQDLQNTLIVGKGGSGKGILLSNGIRHALKACPNLRIVGIDPKGASIEQGYWQGCHQVFSKATFGLAPESVARWLNDSIDAFMKLPGPKLLIVDECKHLSQTLKRCNDKGQAFNLFWYRIESFTSLGDEQQTYVWAISQTAHTQDLAVSGGTRSMFRAIAIVHHKDPGYVHSLVGTTLIPEPKEGVGYVQQLIEESSVGRAFYCSKAHNWYPMPKLANYSAIDRDTRTQIKAATIVQDSPVVEQAKRLVRDTIKPKFYGADLPELDDDLPDLSELFDDFVPPSTVKVDAKIELMEAHSDLRYQCLGGLLKAIRAKGMKTDKLSIEDVNRFNWAKVWNDGSKGETLVKSRDAEGFKPWLNAIAKLGFIKPSEGSNEFIITLS